MNAKLTIALLILSCCLLGAASESPQSDARLTVSVFAWPGEPVSKVEVLGFGGDGKWTVLGVPDARGLVSLPSKAKLSKSLRFERSSFSACRSTIEDGERVWMPRRGRAEDFRIDSFLVDPTNHVKRILTSQYDSEGLPQQFRFWFDNRDTLERFGKKGHLFRMRVPQIEAMLGEEDAVVALLNEATDEDVRQGVVHWPLLAWCAVGDPVVRKSLDAKLPQESEKTRKWRKELASFRKLEQSWRGIRGKMDDIQIALSRAFSDVPDRLFSSPRMNGCVVNDDGKFAYATCIGGKRDIVFGVVLRLQDDGWRVCSYQFLGHI